MAVKEGRKFLYIWGTARYRDVFPDTPNRVTKFCVFADAVMGDPMSEWNSDTNQVEIRFINYRQHNCADEDCEE